MSSAILPRWVGLRKRSCSIITSSQNDSVCGENDAIYESVECHACTQLGVPVFHSTSYTDLLHPPQWEASAGSCLFFPNKTQPSPKLKSARNRPSGPLGPIIDPRRKWASRWNQVVLLSRGVTLAIDPLFFYALSLSIGKSGAPCLYVDYIVAGIVTLLRTCVDVVHVWHLWLQFRMAYVSSESLMIGRGKLVWDPHAIASHYVRSLRGFWFDIFVVLPIPQAIFWLLVPKLVWEEKIKLVLTILLLIVLFQYIPKIYHCFCLMTRMEQATGYVFGTIWWSFGLSIISYLVASHVIGGCWYTLVTHRIISCLMQQCEKKGICNLSLSCRKGVCYQFMNDDNIIGNPCGAKFSTISKPFCLDQDGTFEYGIYEPGVLVVSSDSLAIKILYPIFWGLINLSSFANQLSPTTDCTEVLFSIFIVLCGLALFTIMVGQIQVFLSILLGKNKQTQLRKQHLEWWMRRRQLPSSLRRRVWKFERQFWDVTGGEEQMNWLEELPEGLRRDIKRYLCLDLIKKVPLFHNLEDLILENICDRVKPLFFSKNEKIIREGDLVKRMIFIIRGRVKRYQSLAKDKIAVSVLHPGGFLGDELLSWCLRRPFVDRLPASSALFVCRRSTEVFSLEAYDLRYITDHFRYRFVSDRLRRTMRYYSSNWRTWAAVIIQFAWRRYTRGNMGPVVPLIIYGSVEDRLRHYATLFMSVRPHDHLG